MLRPGRLAAALLAFLWGTQAFAYDQYRPPKSLAPDLRPIEYAPPCTLREAARPPVAKRSDLDEGEALAAGNDSAPATAGDTADARPEPTQSFATLPPAAPPVAPAGRAFDARGPPLRA